MTCFQNDLIQNDLNQNGRVLIIIRRFIKRKITKIKRDLMYFHEYLRIFIDISVVQE